MGNVGKYLEIFGTMLGLFLDVVWTSLGTCLETFGNNLENDGCVVLIYMCWGLFLNMFGTFWDFVCFFCGKRFSVSMREGEVNRSTNTIGIRVYYNIMVICACLPVV